MKWLPKGLSLITHLALERFRLSNKNYLKKKNILINFQAKTWLYLKFDIRCFEQGLKKLSNSMHHTG